MCKVKNTSAGKTCARQSRVIALAQLHRSLFILCYLPKMTHWIDALQRSLEREDLKSLLMIFNITQIDKQSTEKHILSINIFIF